MRYGSTSWMALGAAAYLANAVEASVTQD